METGTTNYKQWSFRLFVYLIVINIITYYEVVNYVSFPGNAAMASRMNFIAIISFGFCLTGTVLTVMSYVKKEERNYQYHVSIWGFSVYTLATIIASFNLYF
jgi:hypothetical protein